MRSKQILLTIVLLVLLVLNIGCQSHSTVTGISAHLSRVISGQTLEITVAGEKYQLRLTGLNAPPLTQKPWGKNAQQFLKHILTHNNSSGLLLVETNLQQKDKFGRLQGYVWCQNQLINQKLVEEGQAIANLTYTDGKYDQKLLQAQNYARIMGKGIWNPRQPLRQFSSSSQFSSQ